MEIKTIIGDITKLEAGAKVVNFFEGLEHPYSELASLDKALDGAVTQLISKGEIKGLAIVN